MLTSRSRSSALFSGLLIILTYAEEAKSDQECDLWKCKGPILLYEGLKCKPVYANPDGCCPVRYDCSHLDKRDLNKYCYANGHEYAFGERQRAEDQHHPCAIGCRCQRSGTFSCTDTVVEYQPLPRPDCYYREFINSCRSPQIVCPKDGEERAKCEIDGKTYLDGQTFIPKKPRNLICVCKPDFKGELVKPFCRSSSCNFDAGNKKIYSNCAPIFIEAYKSSDITICPILGYKCPDKDDKIISATKETSFNPSTANTTSDDMKCKYGKQLLNVGDKLIKHKYIFDNDCIICECDVPPILTCTKLTGSKCKV